MVYLSYWGNLDYLIKKFGKENIIGISRWSKFWNGKVCSKLFPSEKLLKDYKNGLIDEEGYSKIYKKYLMSLNVDNCYKVLNGKVLVCYEKSGFCHRFLVKKWLNYYGYECEEVVNE